MKKKLSKSQLKNQRKKIKPSNVTENKLVNAFRKVFSLNSEDTITLNELSEQVQGFDYRGVNKYIKVIAREILNRNNNGFVDVINSLIQGSRGFNSVKQKELNKALQDTIKQKKIYEPLMNKFEQNVQLIKNIPLEVVQELRNKYSSGVSFRGTEIEEYLTNKLGKRAKLIIRTESSKLNSALTEVRARDLGLYAYIWSTSEDQRVRPSHKMMNGVLVFYGSHIELDKMVGNAGEFPNCRCVGLPVVTIEDIQFPIKVASKILSIESKKDKAIITSGYIKQYTKAQFLNEFGDKIASGL